MRSTKPVTGLDQLVGSLVECLTPESARRLLKLKADPKLQAHVDALAKRHSCGALSAEEQAEYGRYVHFDTFVAIMKSKARQFLAISADE